LKDISEYLKETSAYELFTYLHDKIIKKEITTFSQLEKYTEKLPVNQTTSAVIQKAFNLIKQLYWGFMKDIDDSSYTKLWKELVIRGRKYDFGGDLKRNISISNIYIAILDIHGYTSFCQENKKNLSNLHLLDNFIENGVKKITKRFGTLSQRERGDEIILISSSATDILSVTLSIMDDFSKKTVIKDQPEAQNRSQYEIVLPTFKISAGIAGGNISTPLIVTEKGDLSGFLFNIAARLQVRANELSPKESKIIVSQQVYLSFEKENTSEKSDIYLHGAVYFFNNGPILFKGISISTYEAVFKEGDKYKEKFTKEMEALFKSIKESNWKEAIFSKLMELISKVSTSMPEFYLDSGLDEYTTGLNNSTLARFCSDVNNMYVYKDNYIEAISKLGLIIEKLKQIENFDELTLEYSKVIFNKYTMLINFFEDKVDGEIDKNIDTIFNEKQKRAYYLCRKNIDLFKRLKAYAQKNKAIEKKKFIWYILIDEKKDALKLKLYSGKK
jgi:hypothetical protein